MCTIDTVVIHCWLHFPVLGWVCNSTTIVRLHWCFFHIHLFSKFYCGCSEMLVLLVLTVPISFSHRNKLPFPVWLFTLEKCEVSLPTGSGLRLRRVALCSHSDVLAAGIGSFSQAQRPNWERQVESPWALNTVLEDYELQFQCWPLLYFWCLKCLRVF